MKTKPNSIKPWRCVILAIDPGKEWGADIHVNGEWICSGNWDYPQGYTIQEWCELAWGYAKDNNIPLIVVMESHTRHGKWNTAGLTGVAESVGVWKHYIEQLPKLKWKPKILRVPVDEWRKAIYGFCRLRSQPHFDKETRRIHDAPTGRDTWKRIACKTAGVDSDDEAEAILIGRYACHWWKVGNCAGVKVVD